MSKHCYNVMREDSPAGRKLRPHEAATFLGMSTSTLAKWRVYGIGPAFSRLSRGLVVYDGRDLEAFVAERKRLSTSTQEGR